MSFFLVGGAVDDGLGEVYDEFIDGLVKRADRMVIGSNRLR